MNNQTKKKSGKGEAAAQTATDARMELFTIKSNIYKFFKWIN